MGKDTKNRSSYAEVLLALAANAELRKAERTRLRLLAAVASHLTDGSGPADLRVSDITTTAGIALGTFYRYFEDRREAVAALMSDFSGFLRDRMAASRDGSPGSVARVRSVSLAYVQLFRANAGLMRCLIGLGVESAPFHDRFHALNREWNSRVAVAIAANRTKTRGVTCSAEDVLPIAYALGGMMDEFLTQIYLRCDPALAGLRDHDEKIADLLTELWWRGAYGDTLSA